MKIGRIIFTLRMERIHERLVAEVLHRHAVSAVVGIVDGVQRLMQIADKVDKGTDGFGALQRIGGLVLQDSALLFLGGRPASFRAPVTPPVSFVLPPVIFYLL